MSFPIQASESASRVSRALKLDGKVDLQLDRLALASIQVMDLNQGAFRRDGLVGSLSVDVGTTGAPLELAGFMLVNDSSFPAEIQRLVLENNSGTGTSTFRVALTESAADPAGFGFVGLGQQIVTGEAVSQSKLRRLPFRLLSTALFNPGVASTLFGADVAVGNRVEVVTSPISIAAGGALVAWDLRTIARFVRLSMVAKVWQGS